MPFRTTVDDHILEADHAAQDIIESARDEELTHDKWNRLASLISRHVRKIRRLTGVTAYEVSPIKRRLNRINKFVLRKDFPGVVENGEKLAQELDDLRTLIVKEYAKSIVKKQR